MGTMKLGRLGAVVDLDPNAFKLRGQSEGRTIKVSGEIAPSDADDAKYLRNEMWRMAENGDLFLPFSYSEDSSLDGYYELQTANVDIEIVSLSGWYPFDATMKPFGAVGRASIESRISGNGLRANDHSITDAEPWHAVPAAAIGYDPGATIPTRLSRVFDGSTIYIYRDIDVTVSPIWAVPPANFYDAAAMVEAGSTLRILTSLNAENLPNNWRLSNKGVRVTPNGTNGRIDIAHYDGSQWETAKTFQILVDGSEIGQWDAWSIMRNSPVGSSIRLFRSLASGGVVTLTLVLRRGSRYVEGRITDAASATFKVVRNSTEAATAITGGIRATSNDGDGNRYVLGSSKSVTNDLTEGGIQKSSVTTWDFFIGSEIDGSSAVSGDAAADLVNQYHGYVTETLNPVAR